MPKLDFPERAAENAKKSLEAFGRGVGRRIRRRRNQEDRREQAKTRGEQDAVELDGIHGC